MQRHLSLQAIPELERAKRRAPKWLVVFTRARFEKALSYTFDFSAVCTVAPWRCGTISRLGNQTASLQKLVRQKQGLIVDYAADYCQLAGACELRCLRGQSQQCYLQRFPIPVTVSRLYAVQIATASNYTRRSPERKPRHSRMEPRMPCRNSSRSSGRGRSLWTP